MRSEIPPKTGGFTLVEVLVSMPLLPTGPLALASDPRGTRCTTINSVSTKVKQVIVVVTPSRNPLLHPITTPFTRAISGNGNPLKTE